MPKNIFNEKEINILVADDDPILRDIIVQSLRAKKYQVYEATNGDEVFAICKKHNIHLSILDYQMEPNGVTIAKGLKSIYESPCFLFITSHKGKDIIEEAALVGALNYLVKPIGLEQLEPCIRLAFQRSKELQSLKHNLKHSRAFNIASALMAAHYNIFIEKAEDMVRLEARSKNTKIWVLAEKIIKDFEDRIKILSQK